MPIPFQKTTVFFGFFNKDYTFHTKNLNYNEGCPKYRKNQVFSDIFTFLSIICHNFEYNLRILANFGVKTQNLLISPIPFQKTAGFSLFFFNKDYTFYTKNLFFTTINAKSFVKISFLITFLHF